MPTYNNNVPLATQQINQTQAPIQTNFASLETLIDVDHVDFSDPNYGKHNTVTFPVTNPLSPMFGTTEFALFNEPDPATTLNQLWLNNPTNLAFVQFPIAASIFNTVAAPATSSKGWSVLPSGFTVQWGSQATNDALGSAGTVKFSITYTTRIIQVMVSGYYPGGGANFPPVYGVKNLTTDQFDYIVLVAGQSTNTSVVNYWAIGY